MRKCRACTVNKEITARVSNMDKEGGSGRRTVTGRVTAGMNIVAGTAARSGMTSVTWAAMKGNPDAMAARAMAKAGAQVVGVPDVRLGEELCAWIRLVAGATGDAEEIRAYCVGRIAH